MKNTIVFTGSYTQPLRLGTGQIVDGNGEGITVFRASADGKLTKLSSTITPNPTYLALHSSAAHLLAANFTGGSLSVFPLCAERGLGRLSCFFQHYVHSVNPLRQKEPHVHQAIPDRAGKHVLVPDLGTDEVAVYNADWQRGHLASAPGFNIRTSPGMGPIKPRPRQYRSVRRWL